MTSRPHDVILSADVRLHTCCDVSGRSAADVIAELFVVAHEHLDVVLALRRRFADEPEALAEESSAG